MKGVSTYRFWVRDCAARGAFSVMGVARGVAERELREAGRSLMILSLDIVAEEPRPGPLLGVEATPEGGGGADKEDSGLGGGVGALPSL